jgi:hypothetical protein
VTRVRFPGQRLIFSMNDFISKIHLFFIFAQLNFFDFFGNNPLVLVRELGDQALRMTNYLVKWPECRVLLILT